MVSCILEIIWMAIIWADCHGLRDHWPEVCMSIIDIWCVSLNKDIWHIFSKNVTFARGRSLLQISRSVINSGNQCEPYTCAMCIHVYIYVYVHVHICTYMYVHICMYIYVYIHNSLKNPHALFIMLQPKAQRWRNGESIWLPLPLEQAVRLSWSPGVKDEMKNEIRK